MRLEPNDQGRDKWLRSTALRNIIDAETTHNTVLLKCTLRLLNHLP